MEGEYQQVSAVKKKSAINTGQIKTNKETFRQHQRKLPFGEKMKIAFSLAERDKTIKQAVLLPKTNKRRKIISDSPFFFTVVIYLTQDRIIF